MGLRTTHRRVPSGQSRRRESAGVGSNTGGSARVAGGEQNRFRLGLVGCSHRIRARAQLNPGYGTAHYWYSYYFVAMGRLDDAAREVKRALELDPLSLNTNAEMGRTYVYQRKYDAAIEQERKTLELDHTFV